MNKIVKKKKKNHYSDKKQINDYLAGGAGEG